MRNAHRKPGAFRRGLWISPFQIPILAYLCLQGLLTIPAIDKVSDELHVPDWSLWNFVVILVIGTALATVARFNANERLEEFGLHLTGLAVTIAAVLQLIGHQYSLGDEVAILLGCFLRVRVLRRNRKAERRAIEIIEEHDREEEQF